MQDKKGFGFSDSVKTEICFETPSSDNPYSADQRYIHGYSVDDLAKNTNIVDSLLLLFTGELPSDEDMTVFNALLVGLMNLGPRNPAIRAAMTAGISKVNVEHILPIGLIAAGGSSGGAIEVSESLKFIQTHVANKTDKFEIELNIEAEDPHKHVVPGFGSAYGDIDPVINRLADYIFSLKPDSKLFKSCISFNHYLFSKNAGWLPSGLVAAVCLELGIGTREAAGIFQLVCAPGILAHGMEQTHRPISDMPILEDENYVLEK